MTETPRKRDYKKEYQDYQGTPEQIHNRSLRNQARRKLESEGRAAKGDGMDVDHKKSLKRGGTNADDNLREKTVLWNRGWRGRGETP